MGRDRQPPVKPSSERPLQGAVEVSSVYVLDCVISVAAESRWVGYVFVNAGFCRDDAILRIALLYKVEIGTLDAPVVTRVEDVVADVIDRGHVLEIGV